MNWQLALSEIAVLARKRIAVREAGFTDEALKHPRSEAGFLALCAWNGTDPEKAPEGWHYAPSAHAHRSWERVVEAMSEYWRKQWWSS